MRGKKIMIYDTHGHISMRSVMAYEGHDFGCWNWEIDMEPIVDLDGSSSIYDNYYLRVGYGMGWISCIYLLG